MIRPAIPFVVILSLVAGCQGSQSGLSGLNPYGNAVVPPPSTNSYGRAGTYYQGPTLPQGTPSIPVGKKPKAVSLGGVEPRTSVAPTSAASEAWVAAGERGVSESAGAVIADGETRSDSNVVQATFQTPDRVPTAASAEPSIRIHEPATIDPAAAFRAKGMPVNDLTRAGAAGTATQNPGLVEITQLPPVPAANANRQPTLQTSVSNTPVGTGVSNSQAWKSRYAPLAAP